MSNTYRERDKYYLTSFFGGTRRGKCLQITSTNQEGHGCFQLTQKEAEQLSYDIDAWLTEIGRVAVKCDVSTARGEGCVVYYIHGHTVDECSRKAVEFEEAIIGAKSILFDQMFRKGDRMVAVMIVEFDDSDDCRFNDGRGYDGQRGLLLGDS